MQNRSLTLAGLAVGIGLVILGIFIYFGIIAAKSQRRSVTVKGLSEIEVPANKVIWPIMYTILSDDLEQVYNVIEQNNATITTFLTSNGIDANEISTSAPMIVDTRADRYNQNPAPYRYNAVMVLTVTSEKVDKIRELMVKQSALLKKGIAIGGDDYRFQTQFEFTGLNDVKPQMIQEATRNARASAEKFAEDSNSRLGNIISATQGQLSISDRDANTPYIKALRVVTTVEFQLKN